MSKQSKNQPWQNHLDDLFDELEEDNLNTLDLDNPASGEIPTQITAEPDSALVEPMVAKDSLEIPEIEDDSLPDVNAEQEVEPGISTVEEAAEETEVVLSLEAEAEENTAEMPLRNPETGEKDRIEDSVDSGISKEEPAKEVPSPKSIDEIQEENVQIVELDGLDNAGLVMEEAQVEAVSGEEPSKPQDVIEEEPKTAISDISSLLDEFSHQEDDTVKVEPGPVDPAKGRKGKSDKNKIPMNEMVTKELRLISEIATANIEEEVIKSEQEPEVTEQETASEIESRLAVVEVESIEEQVDKDIEELDSLIKDLPSFDSYFNLIEEKARAEEQEVSALEVDEEAILESIEMDSPPVEEEPAGWEWEINLDGEYIYCSDGITRVLGFSSKDFIGKRFSSYSIVLKSILPIESALANDIFPVEVTANFHTAQEKQVKVLLKIQEKLNSYLVRIGWHGTAEPLAEEETEVDDLLLRRSEPHKRAPNIQETANRITSFATGRLPSEHLDFLRDMESQPENKKLSTEFKLDSKTKGVLEIEDSNPDRIWTQNERILIEQVADQLSLALENAQLFQQTQQALAETDEQARRLAFLNEMSNRLTQEDDIQVIYDITIEQAKKIFQTDVCSLTLLSASPLSENSAAYQAVRANRVIIAENESYGRMSSVLACPISLSGKTTGTINVEKMHTNEFKGFSSRDANIAQQITSLLSASLENRQLFDAIENALDEAEEQRRRLALLNEMAEMISQENDIESICNITSLKVLQILRPSNVAIYMITQDDEEMVELVSTQGINVDQPHTRHDITGDLITVFDEQRVIPGTHLEEGSPFRSKIIAPVMVANKPVGAIQVSSTKPDIFKQPDENMLAQISSLLSSTVENSQLFSQIQRRSIQLAASAEISRRASAILDTEQLIAEVVELMTSGFDLYFSGIYMVDNINVNAGGRPIWAALTAGSGEAGKKMKERLFGVEIGENSMVGKAISTLEAQISYESEKLKNDFLPEVQSELALPLLAFGEALGAISIISNKDSQWSEEDITALQTMADQLANAIENARLFEQTETRAEELAVLNEMARAFTQNLEVTRIIELVYEYSTRLIQTRNFYIALYNEKDEIVTFPIMMEREELVDSRDLARKGGNGITEYVIRSKEPLLLMDDVEKFVREMELDATGEMAKSWLGVPMTSGNRVLGILAMQCFTEVRKFNQHDMDMLSAVANQAAVALQNARLFDETRKRARREQILREITASVHSSADPDTILRTAVREVSNALGRKAFISMGKSEDSE